MKKNITYLGQYKQSLLYIKDNLNISFLIAALMDTFFVAGTYGLLTWMMARLTTLLTSLQSVNLTTVMTQSNAQLQSSLTVLQSFMKGMLVTALLTLSGIALLWFITRWILWTRYEEEPFFSTRFLFFCFRSKMIFLLALPFLAYPIIVIANATKLGHDANFWVGVLFLMIVLYLHFSCVNAKVFFQQLSFKAHMGKVIKGGWRSLLFTGPWYIAVIFVGIILFILLTFLASKTSPMVGQIALFVTGIFLIGICRLFVRSLKID